MPGLIAKGSQVGQAQMSEAIPEIQRLSAQFIENLETARRGQPNREKK
jgi:hypothetical protein